MAQEHVPQPPRPPNVSRRVHFHPLQMVGVPLLALVPLLAMFGVFGLTRAHAELTSVTPEVSLEYPTVLRYKTVGEVVVEISNESESATADVEVVIDREYIDGFSAVSFLPEVGSVTADRYVVALGDVAPGTSRIVAIELQAEDYWGHSGEIRVVAGGAAVASFDLSTFVFP